MATSKSRLCREVWTSLYITMSQPPSPVATAEMLVCGTDGPGNTHGRSGNRSGQPEFSCHGQGRQQKRRLVRNKRCQNQRMYAVAVH